MLASVKQPGCPSHLQQQQQRNPKWLHALVRLALHTDLLRTSLGSMMSKVRGKDAVNLSVNRVRNMQCLLAPKKHPLG